MLSNCAIYWCRYRKMSTEDVVKCARIVEAELLRRILKIHVKSFMWDKVGGSRSCCATAVAPDSFLC